MNKQEWIAEFAKEFHAQTQIKYSSCFEVAESLYEHCSENTPDEAVQAELSRWGDWL